MKLVMGVDRTPPMAEGAPLPRPTRGATRRLDQAEWDGARSLQRAWRDHVEQIGNGSRHQHDPGRVANPAAAVQGEFPEMCWNMLGRDRQLHARDVVRPQGDVVTAQDLLEGCEEAALKGGALSCDHTLVYTPPTNLPESLPLYPLG